MMSVGVVSTLLINFTSGSLAILMCPANSPSGDIGQKSKTGHVEHLRLHLLTDS